MWESFYERTVAVKRLLLLCGIAALLLVPSAFAGKPAPGPLATLALTSCVSPCVMAEPQPGYFHADLWFTGAGYSQRTAYAVCVTGPTAWCGGLYGAVNASGTISFSIGAVHPGDYTVQVFVQGRQGLAAVSPMVSVTLITP